MRERMQGEAALRQAQKAAKHGRYGEAERWAKLAERMAEAAERLAAIAPEAELDEAEARTRLLARIRRLVELEPQVAAWERESAAYVERLAAGGESAPPPPHPVPGAQGEDWIEKVLQEETAKTKGG